MSPDKFIYSNCNFFSSTFSVWGSFSYKKGDQIDPIDRYIDICYNCEAIAPVEKLPTKKDLRITKQMSDFEKPIRDAEDRLQLLSDRESEARCLKCGGQYFTIIPNDYSYSRNFKSGKPYLQVLLMKGVEEKSWPRKVLFQIFLWVIVCQNFFIRLKGLRLNNKK